MPERVIGWAWWLLAGIALLAWFSTTRYQHLSSRDVWTQTEQGQRQLELHEVVWDRWRWQTCFLVQGVRTRGGTRDYERFICW
jgi:hypothetical protein